MDQHCDQHNAGKEFLIWPLAKGYPEVARKCEGSCQDYEATYNAPVQEKLKDTIVRVPDVWVTVLEF